MTSIKGEYMTEQPYLAPCSIDAPLVIQKAGNGGYTVMDAIPGSGLVPNVSAFSNAADLLAALQLSFGGKQ